MPAQVSAPQERGQGSPLAFVACTTQMPPGIQQSRKAMDAGMLLEQPPIEPIGFIVLAISVVVAMLGAAKFIAHQKHGQAKGEQGGGQEIFYLAIS